MKRWSISFTHLDSGAPAIAIKEEGRIVSTFPTNGNAIYTAVKETVDAHNASVSRKEVAAA